LFGRRARDADIVSQIVDGRFEIDRSSQTWIATITGHFREVKITFGVRTLDFGLWTLDRVPVPIDLNPIRYFFTQTRNGNRKLVRACRSITQPERNRRRLTVRIFNPHLALFDAQHAPRRVPELKDIALQTFN